MKKRFIHLCNFVTGESVSAQSVVDFCKKVGFKKNERYHLTPILEGKEISFKNWVLPETYKFLSTKLDLIDIFGNEYCLTPLEVMNKIGKKRNFSGDFGSFVRGKIKSIKGLHIKGSQTVFTKPLDKIQEIVLEKDGVQISAGSKAEASKKIGISRRSLIDMSYGRKEKTKDWRIKDIKMVENRSVFPFVNQNN